MSDEYDDPGADDGGVDADDLATTLRRFADAAMRVSAAAMTDVAVRADLPLQVANESMSWGYEVFRDGFDPNRLEHSRRIRRAGVAVVGVDILRIDVSTSLGDLSIIEGASFLLIAPPPGTADASTILKLDTQPVFLGPDAGGWLSTAPDRRLEDCETWRDRIDAIDRTRRILLVFKLRVSARAFIPSSVWF